MAISVEEMKPLKLYSSMNKLLVPINDEDKKKGSAIFLVSPNHESSMKTMQLPYLINRKYFESYYTEKDVSFIINKESGILESADNQSKQEG